MKQNYSLPKAIIFDIDGTLLDSVDLHAKAWQETFQHFGHEIPFQAIRDQIGKGGDQLLPVFLSKEELAEKQKALEEFRGSLFKKKYLSEVRPFPNVRQLFQMVKSHGQQAAIASSAKPEELEVYKKIADITDLVNVGTSSGDAKRSKPHPDIFEAALAQLGDQVQPEDVVIVGDSPYDAEAARKAGVKAVGVLCGGFSRESLIKAGCIAIYADPTEVLGKFENSPLVGKMEATT